MAEIKIKLSAQTEQAAKDISKAVKEIVKDVDKIPAAVTPAVAAVDDLSDSMKDVGQGAGTGVKTFTTDLQRAIGPIRAVKLSQDELRNSTLGGVSAMAKFSAETARAKTTVTAITPPIVAATKAIQQVPGNSNRASFAVLNLGRIAQDSAFGFIGIANNIEPFIQSLTALRRESGSAKGALSAFFGSLAGPAGIGLIIGAVSLIDAWSKGYGIFAGRTKEAEKAQTGMARVTQKLNTDYADQTNLLKVVTAAQLANAEAGKQQINVYSQLSKSVRTYVENLGKQEIIKELLPQFNKIVGAAIEAQKQLERIDLGLELFDPEDEAKERQRLQRIISNSEKQILNAQKLFNKVGGGAAGLSQLLGVTESEAAKVTDSIDKVSKAYLENEEFLKRNIRTGEANLTVLKLTKDEVDAITLSLSKQNEQQRIAQALSKFGAGLGPGRFEQFDPTDLNANANAQAEIRDNELRVAAINAGINSIASAAAQNLTPAIVGIFDSFGQGANAVQSLGKAFVTLTKQIAASVVQALILRAITGALGGLSPAGAIGKAIGFLGGGSISGLATGGIATRPTARIFGEAGPEAVIPLSQFDNIVGSRGSGDVNVTGRFTGQDLYLTSQSGGLSYSRLFG